MWSEVTFPTCYLQNRIPYKKTGKTPYESWKGHAPNLKYLKVWGCLARVMLPDPKKRENDQILLIACLLGMLVIVRLIDF